MERLTLEKHAHTFLTQLFNELEKCGISVSELPLDHICWRCASQADFLQMEKDLLTYGSIFHKSIHNGRIISLIELETPIQFKERHISILELPTPKSGKHYQNGFEHAEFVVSDRLDLWYKQYKLPWIIDNIHKEINPDVKLLFDRISVKFHPYSLAHVVKHLE